MSHKLSEPLSGALLLADFQTVFISTATIGAAEYEAERSESQLMEQLGSMGNGTYLQPSSLTNYSQDDISRASLDAHIKKVQAQQLGSMNQLQLQTLLQKDQALYSGRKLQVTKLAHDKDMIISEWFNPQTGYRQSLTKGNKITGIIESVILDKNMIVLKPTLKTRLLQSELTNYAVYIIDPNSLEPMVELAIL